VATRKKGLLVPLQNLVAKAIKKLPRLGEFAIKLQRITIEKYSMDLDEPTGFFSWNFLKACGYD
jgi:hypothetical protein